MHPKCDKTQACEMKTPWYNDKAKSVDRFLIKEKSEERYFWTHKP